NPETAADSAVSRSASFEQAVHEFTETRSHSPARDETRWDTRSSPIIGDRNRGLKRCETRRVVLTIADERALVAARRRVFVEHVRQETKHAARLVVGIVGHVQMDARPGNTRPSFACKL